MTDDRHLNPNRLAVGGFKGGASKTYSRTIRETLDDAKECSGSSSVEPKPADDTDPKLSAMKTSSDTTAKDLLAELYASPAAIGEQRSVAIDGQCHWYLKVFEPHEAIRVYTDRNGEPPQPPSMIIFGAEHGGDNLLRAMAHDPMRGWRLMPVGSEAKLAALVSLAGEMPNFAEVTSAVELACRASLVTGLPWRLPVIVLDGPPGAGKTRWSKRIARILGSSIWEIAVPQMTGASPLTGSDQSWKHPRAGKIAHALIRDHMASPCFLLDEIDKANSYAGDAPLDVLHGLWEPENARSFIDECLGCHFAAHHVIWIATANETHRLRETLLDRAQVYAIETPDQKQMEAVIRAIYLDLSRDWYGWFTAEIDPEVIRCASTNSPRQIKAALHDAMIRAAAEGRTALEPDDMTLANSKRQARENFGFIASRVGFV
ncbi:MAG: AAA family ATPase [Methylobacterium sp.]|nr:AAA family ATPase [Methylobacterium sp.]